MTDKEKQLISELRSAGRSYQDIADETGISIGSIKMYFSRSKDTGSAPRCEQCNRPLRQDVIRTSRRFCSDKCRVRWWEMHPDKSQSAEQHRFTCAVCGKVFFSKKPHKYCTRACYYASRKGGGSR
ncbi:MAG: sigma-70 family RNA polymerase sigma factor [Clostridia bacterium]|nr:sigma-70 family RNA polymerase sigma factor [Clostridia bacterium]